MPAGLFAAVLAGEAILTTFAPAGAVTLKSLVATGPNEMSVAFSSSTGLLLPRE